MAFLVNIAHNVFGNHSSDASTPSKINDVASSRSSSEDIQELVDSAVFQLYGPAGSEANLDIIFLHDLLLLKRDDAQSALHMDTWRAQSDENVIWPKEWLPRAFPQARVLTVSYDASITEGYRQGRQDLYLVAEKLLHDLILVQAGEQRPIIFVGHGYGGIIIKQLCYEAHVRTTWKQSEIDRERLQMIMDNISGIFFYSTPHHGVTGLRDIIQNRNPKGKQAALLQHAQLLNENLERLNQDYEHLPYKWQTVGMGASLPTNLQGRGDPLIMVGEGSARCENFIVIKEDHGSVCRPKSETSISYSHLVEFISKIMIENEARKPDDVQVFPSQQVGQLSEDGRQEYRKIIEEHTVVGLCGMGGIGKTTLAKALFSDLHPQFEYTLFVEKVKDIKSTRDSDFEEQVLRSFCRRGKFLNFNGTKRIWITMEGKKALVVFDDVAQERELKLLHKLINVASRRSRFIVTARDTQILGQVNGVKVVEVRLLDRKAAQLLLTSYALPSTEYVMTDWQEEYVKALVKVCDGLPLFLEVVGKLLKGREAFKEKWEAIVDSFQQLDENSSTVKEILGVLRVTYEMLEDGERRMFLDAATTFQGLMYVKDPMSLNTSSRWTLGDARAVWKVKFKHQDAASHYRERLVQLAMIHEGEENSTIRMHELWKNFGASEAEKRKYTTKIHAVDLAEDPYLLVSNSSEVRSLEVSVPFVETAPRSHHCRKCAVKDIGTEIHGSIRGYERDEHSSRAKSWLRCVRSMRELFQDKDRYYSYGTCDHYCPSVSLGNLQRLQRLETLHLRNCQVLDSEVVLPSNLHTFCAYNVRVKNLRFDMCSSLVFLRLEVHKVKHLPSSFCELKHLRYLHLQARALLSLPDHFGRLQGLRVCSLACPLVHTLPDSFCDLKGLEGLTLMCRALKHLPTAFGALTALQSLTITGCEIRRLPDSFGDLRQLENLQFAELNNLQSLPGKHFTNLSKLQVFLVTLCSTLKSIQSVMDLKQLRFLNLMGCIALEELPPGLEELMTLEELDIRFCVSLDRVEDNVRRMRGRLKVLGIHSDGETLREMLDGAECMEHLALTGFGAGSIDGALGKISMITTLSLTVFSTEVLPDAIGEAKALRRLLLVACDELKCLPETLGQLTALDTLVIGLCPELRTLPESLGQLKALEVVLIQLCDGLECLPESVGQLPALEYIVLQRCKLLGALPSSWGCAKSLKVMELCGLRSLASLPIDTSLGKFKAALVEPDGMTISARPDMTREEALRCVRCGRSGLMTEEGLAFIRQSMSIPEAHDFALQMWNSNVKALHSWM